MKKLIILILMFALSMGVVNAWYSTNYTNRCSLNLTNNESMNHLNEIYNVNLTSACNYLPQTTSLRLVNDLTGLEIPFQFTNSSNTSIFFIYTVNSSWHDNDLYLYFNASSNSANSSFVVFYVNGEANGCNGWVGSQDTSSVFKGTTSCKVTGSTVQNSAIQNFTTILFAYNDTSDGVYWDLEDVTGGDHYRMVFDRLGGACGDGAGQLCNGSYKKMVTNNGNKWETIKLNTTAINNKRMAVWKNGTYIADNAMTTHNQLGKLQHSGGTTGGIYYDEIYGLWNTDATLFRIPSTFAIGTVETYSSGGSPDTTAPNSVNVMVTNASPKYNELATFNATWTDDVGLSGYIFWSNASGNSSFIPFTGLTNYSNYSMVINYTRGTNISFIFYANDTTGNMNQTLLQTLLVNDTAPSIATINRPQMYYNYSSPRIEFNLSATDIDNDALRFFVYVNGTLNSSQTVKNFTYNFSQQGYYYLEILASDDYQNASANSTAIYFTTYNSPVWFNSNPSEIKSFRITQFINVSNTTFTLGGVPYHLIGADSYYLADYATNHTYDDNGHEINNSQQYVLEILNEAQSLGINVIRTWANMEGGGQNGSWVINNTGGHHNLFEVSVAGNYSEEMFKAMDWVIYQASLRDIRLQMVLVNNWNEYGGMRWYAQMSPTTNKTFAGVSDNSYANWSIFHDQFYTDVNCINYYQNYINHTLNRNNTYTGILYKNDPTIFAWLLANEPRAKSDNGGVGRTYIVNWTKNMTAYVKSIDTNHLVGLGIEGFGEPFEGTDMIADHNGTGVDFATFELHPAQWDWLAQRSENATDAGWVTGGITTNATIDWWTNGSGYSYNNRYEGGFVPNYIPALARHSYANWVSQNVNWSTYQLNMPVLLQELAIPNAPTNGLKTKFYHQAIHNFYASGGDGLLFWNLNHDNYYYSTTPVGIMDDGYSFYVSDDATLKAISKYVIEAFNFTKYDNAGGSWVTSLNNYKYDFTINVNWMVGTSIDNCSVNFNIYNGSYYNVTQINNSAIIANTDYVFTRQFASTDINFTWYSECCSAGTCTDSSTSSVSLGGGVPIVTLLYPTNSTYASGSPVFYYNVTDALDIRNCDLYINSVLTSTDTTVSKNINQTLSANLATANYTWFVQCTDIGDTIGTSATGSINIDATPPSLVLIAPLNQANITTRKIDFIANASDNFGLFKYWLTVSWTEGIDGRLVTSLLANETNITVNQTLSFYNDGVYIWNYTVQDYVGNYNYSPTWNFTIKTFPEIINVGYIQPTISTLKILYNTSHIVNFTVNYGTTTALGNLMYNNTFATGAQTFTIPVAQGTLYYVNFTVCTVYNFCNSSTQYVFTSLASSSSGSGSPSGGITTFPVLNVTPYCGNHICDVGETSQMCPQDCGIVLINPVQLPFVTKTDVLQVGDVTLEISMNKQVELTKSQSIVLKTTLNGTPVDVDAITFTIYNGQEQVFILNNFVKMKTGEYSSAYTLNDLPIGQYVAQFKLDKDGKTFGSDSIVLNIIQPQKSFLQKVADFFISIFKSIQGYLISHIPNKTQNLNTTQ